MASDVYQAIIREVITPERWRAILEGLAAKAEAGDLVAIRMILPYLGRPKTPPPGQLSFTFEEEEG